MTDENFAPSYDDNDPILHQAERWRAAAATLMENSEHDATSTEGAALSSAFTRVMQEALATLLLHSGNEEAHSIEHFVL